MNCPNCKRNEGYARHDVFERLVVHFLQKSEREAGARFVGLSTFYRTIAAEIEQLGKEDWARVKAELCGDETQGEICP